MLCRIDPTDITLLIAGFVALLGVLIVARRRSSRQVLRTFCVFCELPFEAWARLDVLGFRHMTCRACANTAAYPLSRWFAATYVVVFALACTVTTCHLVADPTWLPNGRAIWFFVVLPAVALVRNHGRSRLLARVAARRPEPITPMERVGLATDPGALGPGVASHADWQE